jgi:hypothetical protein
MSNYNAYYLPDPQRQAEKKTIESLVHIFRDIWQDLTPKVDVLFTDKNTFNPPAGKPIILKEWQWTCKDHTVTIKIRAARLMMECDVLIVQRYPIDEGNWTTHQVEIIDNEQ